jgi:electron transfer flavoprotein beta subunit
MPYNCIAIVREAWDTRDLVGNVMEGGKPDEKKLTTRFEPEDLNALEMALKIKEKEGGKVTAIAFGEPKNVDVLRECLYREIDEVIRINDPSVSQPDTAMLAGLFAKAVQKIGAYDLILTGIDVTEGENSLLGAQIAEILNIEMISYVDNIESLSPGKAACKREISMGCEVVEAKLPALLVVGVALLKDDPRTPRSAKATLKLKHKKTPIPSWASGDLGAANVSGLKTTQISGYEAVPERVIESKQVDPQDESALKAMLAEIKKGA